MPFEDYQKLFNGLKNEELQKAAIIHRCATDLDLFARLFFPHYCTRPFNHYHRYYFKTALFGERNIRRATAAPRGSAKSTMVTLIKPIHDLCYGLEPFILFISSTTPLTNKKLKDIRMEIYSNVELRSIYGTRFQNRKAGESEFLGYSDLGRTFFAAVGRGSEVRGIRFGSSRPSKIVCDDVEFSEEIYNEKTRSKTADWYFEDVGKVGDTGTNFEFVGTVLHRDSLLSKLLKNPSYDSAIFKSIMSWSDREDLWNEWRIIYRNLDNPKRVVEAEEFYAHNMHELLKGTEVLWPEKEDYLAHMKDMEEIGRRAFMKEKQNEPQGSEEAVFETLHRYKEVPEGFQIESSGAIVKWDDLTPVGAIDPSVGRVKASQGKLGDYTVIVTGYIDNKGRVFVHHDFTKRAPPSKYIQEIFELHEKFQYTKFAVETNLYRDLLLPNILDEKKRREKAKGKAIKLAFYEVEQTENKRERITRLEPKINHGNILFSRSLSQTFVNQFMEFPHADHDDAPDVVEILWNLAHNRYKPSALSISAMSGY